MDLEGRLKGIGSAVKEGVRKVSGYGKRAVMVPVIAAGLAGMPERADADLVTFNPTQSGNVADPVYGLSATSNNYWLTYSGDVSALPRTFMGDNQENIIFGFEFPSAMDAASFNEQFKLILSDNNNIYMVDLLGNEQNINGNPNISAGNNAFGIGYDADANVLGIGRYDAGQMTFLTYDFNLNTFTSTNTFAFNQSQYGTPTGLDFKVVNGQPRMIVGTRDYFDLNTELTMNQVLDMSLTGDIGQRFTTPGGTYKLEDIHIDLNNIAIGYRRSDNLQGRVEVGEFGLIPEPGTIALMILFGSAIAGYARRNFRDDYKQ